MDEVWDLVSRAWADSYRHEAIWDYDIDFLEWYLEKQAGTEQYGYAFYADGKMIAFVGGVVRNYRFGDRFLPGFFCTFLSVDPAYKRRGLASQLLEKTNLILNKDYEDTGFPAIFAFYLDAIQPTSQVFEKALRAMGLPFHVVCRVNLKVKAFDVPALRSVLDLKGFDGIALWLAGFLGPRELDGELTGVRLYRESDLETCVEIANEAAKDQEFTPHWEAGSIGRQLAYRKLASTLVSERSETVTGFVNYRIFDLLGKGERQKMGVIDWVSDQRLTVPERKRLIGRCLSEFRRSDCCAVIFPDLPLLTRSALGRAGFLTNRRKVYLSCVTYDTSINLTDIAKAYEILC
jgi:GNAT superfamily N-acetyltransferase